MLKNFENQDDRHMVVENVNLGITYPVRFLTFHIAAL